MYTERYPTGLCWRHDGVGEGSARPTPRQGARERILSASQQLLRDQGINRTGMDQLARQTRCRSARLISTFTGKDKLVTDTFATSTRTSCPESSTAPTLHAPPTTSSLPSRSARPGSAPSSHRRPRSKSHNHEHPASQHTHKLRESLRRAGRRKTAREGRARNPRDSSANNSALLLDGASARTRVAGRRHLPHPPPPSPSSSSTTPFPRQVRTGARGGCRRHRSCWLVSNFHDFTISVKFLTCPEVGVPGTLWLSDLLPA